MRMRMRNHERKAFETFDFGLLVIIFCLYLHLLILYLFSNNYLPHRGPTKWIEKKRTIQSKSQECSSQRINWLKFKECSSQMCTMQSAWHIELGPLNSDDMLTSQVIFFLAIKPFGESASRLAHLWSHSGSQLAESLIYEANRGVS